MTKEVLEIIENSLIQNVSDTLKRLEPAAKRIASTIDIIIKDFRILKAEKDSINAVENISESMEDLGQLCYVLGGYMKDIIKRFSATVAILSAFMEDAVKNKGVNQVAAALHAQKMINSEKEYLGAIGENINAGKEYARIYSKNGINYTERILEAAETDKLTQRLEAIKLSVLSMLVDRQRNTQKSLEEIKRQIEEFPALEKLRN